MNAIARVRIWTTLSLACCLLLAPPSSHAQSKPPEPPQTLKLRKPDERRIVLDAIALDPQGLPLRSLNAKNFSIRVDGRQIDGANIRFGNDSGEQTQIVIVLDAVNCSITELTRSIDAVHTYLHLSNGHLAHPTSIFIFADTNTQPQAHAANDKSATMKDLYAYRIPASQDGLVLSHALDEYDPGLRRVRISQDRPAPPDQVRLSLRALDALASAMTPVTGPKLVLWVSPGWPYFTSSPRSSEQIFGSVIYFSELLRSARMSLYCIDPQGLVSQDNSATTEAFLLSSRPGMSSIGPHSSGQAPPGPDYYKSFIRPVRRASDADPNDLSLEVLAIGSGGLVIQNKNDLVDQIARCAAEADGHLQFSVTAEPSTTGTAFHPVSASLSATAGSVRVRPGFYAR